MKSLGDLLDRIKKHHAITTETALATALGVKKQTLSNWRNGHNLPDPVACATIAGLTGEPLARVLGIVGEARALSREEKAVWRKLAATAALLLLAVAPGLNNAATTTQTTNSDRPDMHYANLRTVLNFILGVFGLRHGPATPAMLA